MLEHDYNRRFSAKLREQGAVVFAVVGGEMQAAGWPDRYVAHKLLPQKDCWVEGKFHNNQLTALQRETMKRLVERGVHALVARWDGWGTCVFERWDGSEVIRFNERDALREPVDVLLQALEKL